MMLKTWVKRLVLLGTILAALLVLTGCTGGGGLAHLWGEIIVDGQPFLGPVPITVTTGDGQVRQEIFTEGRYEFRDLPAGTVVLETPFSRQETVGEKRMVAPEVRNDRVQPRVVVLPRRSPQRNVEGLPAVGITAKGV